MGFFNKKKEERIGSVEWQLQSYREITAIHIKELISLKLEIEKLEKEKENN